MTPPWISVVIATLNRWSSLDRLLAQLGEQTLSPAEYEVVVVDDGSAEPVRGRLEERKTPFVLHVEEQPNQGAAAARHRGVERARGDILVILDDDMQVGP